MDAEQAIHNFWSSFGIPAYDENSVPDDANLPYITYSISFDGFDYAVNMTASVWYRSNLWSEVTDKAKQICNKITDGGIMLKTDNGRVWLRKSTPVYYRVGEEDKAIKRIRFNVAAEYILNNL